MKAVAVRREIPVQRTDGSTLVVRDYEMIERIPTPKGGLDVRDQLVTPVATNAAPARAP
jgi:hypothetical protein